MSIIPGEEPRRRGQDPLIADQPLPPGNGDIEEKVEELDQRLRAHGPDETEQAQKAKDAKDEPSENEEDQPDVS